MNGIWVLIVISSVYGGANVTTQEFFEQHTCVQAKDILDKQDSFVRNFKAFCVPK